MPIATLAAYRTQVAASYGTYSFSKTINVSSNQAPRPTSSWLEAPGAGAAPTTAVACSRSTTGALVLQPPLTATTNPLYLAGVELASSVRDPMTVLLVDRLSHQGGLSGTVITAQATNLPTAALTRYTSGAGVMAAVEIYTNLGATATTATASYTNQAGVSGRTTQPIVVGGTGANLARNFLPLPLQDGDTGVRSVESVTLLANTTSAGNFGITLFKPLLQVTGVSATPLGQQPNYWDGLLCGGQKLIEADDDACLMVVGIPNNTSNATIAGTLTILEVA